MRSLACARTPLKYVPCAYVKCSLPNRYAHALRSHKFFSSTDETNPVRQQPASSIAKPACMNMIRADARMIHLAQGSLFTDNVFDCCMEPRVCRLHVSKVPHPRPAKFQSNPTAALCGRMRHRSVDTLEPPVERRIIPHRLLQAPHCRGYWLGKQQARRSSGTLM